MTKPTPSRVGFLTENEKGDPKGRLAKSRKLVPEARVELARRETTVFETAASAIPPLGHISLHSITEARIRVHDKIAPRLALLSRTPQSARTPPAPPPRGPSPHASRSPGGPPPGVSAHVPSLFPRPRPRPRPRASPPPSPARALRARPILIFLSRIARLRAVRGLRTGVKLVR